MINRLKLFINNEKSLFNENKIKYIFSTIILISIGLLSFMLPSFSSGPLHKIPLLFTGILCLMIFIYIFSFDNFTISKYAIFMIMFLLAIFISSLLNDITQIQKTEFLLIIMFIMLHMFVSKNDFVDKAIFALYIGLCFFLLYFFISYFKQIISLDFNRLGGAFGNVNAIGEYFIIGYLINMYLAIIRKKYLLLLTVPFFIVFGLFTGSKSFFMSLVILSQIQPRLSP